MANKAPTILMVDKSTERVTYSVNGVTKTDRFSYLSKVARLAVLKSFGWKSEGKPPMHCTDAEILSAWQKILGNGGTVPPTTPKEETMPKQPETPSVSQPTVTKPQGGALEEALGGILGGLVTAQLGEVHAELRSVRDLIAKTQPKVTEVHLGNGEIRKLDGIQHAVFPTVLTGISERMPLWLVGPAGTGKSTIGEQAAQALGLDFSSKSCSAQTTEVALLGYMSATGDYVTTEFRKRYEHGGVFLLDEVDNGNPNVLTVLNSALSNSFMAFPDGMVHRHENFVLVATANTFGNGATAEYVGRNPIDKAFINRFSVIQVGYDSAVEEAMLASVVGLPTAVATKWLTAVRKMRANAETSGLKVIVSPRATLQGAKWLRNGVPMSTVIEMTVLKGTKDDQSAKILDGVAL